MNIERYNYEDKKKKHLDNKKDLEARIGPGSYLNPKVHSEFRPEKKPEYLQFFNTTEERFKHFPVNNAQFSAASAGNIPPLHPSTSLPDNLNASR